MIEINNLSKKYKNKYAVKDINLNIKKHKLTALIGANGAGKSTVLNMIARLLDKSNGQIKIDNQIIEDYNKNDLAKKIAVLRQSNFINAKIKIYDLVSFGRFPYSQGNLTKEDYRIIDDAINYLELDEIKDSYLDEVSGGQKQRALIAMIVAQDTEYILLDEPLNNLDMHHSTSIMKILKKLVEQQNKTILIVIHDINYTSCYADEIVAFKDGKVAMHDQTNNVINKQSLESIFDHKFEIINKDNYKFCQYYQ